MAIKTIKKILKEVLPYGIVKLVQEKERERKRKIFADKLLSSGSMPWEESLDWNKIIDFLESQHCSRQEVVLGSMPLASLLLIEKTLRQSFDRVPIKGIHIGNFVGVSMAWITHACRQIHPESMVIGIDPNLPHRGIINPQRYVTKLLQHYRLTNNSMKLAGYSLDKCQSNDGMDYVKGYHPAERYHAESACENALGFCERFINGGIDFALIDGNHDDVYLARELDAITRFLKPGGLLILDDVSDGWAGVKSRFEQLKARFEEVVEDGRIGIVRSQ